MFKFFNSFFGTDNADSQLLADVQSAADALDIPLAKAAHENWKHRLQAYLDGTSQEEFLPEVICFDDRCDLGRWIHGEGQKRLGRFAGFTALMGHHKMFHYAASNVVALAKSGKQAEARKMMDVQFRDYSLATIDSLNSLERMVARPPAKRK